MAARGFVVASSDYRLSGVASFPAPLNDARQALHWLYEHASKFGGDAERIAVSGASAGAHLAALLALTGPDDLVGASEGEHAARDAAGKISAVISWFPVTDLVGWDTELRIAPYPPTGSFAAAGAAKRGWPPPERSAALLGVKHIEDASADAISSADPRSYIPTAVSRAANRSGRQRVAPFLILLAMRIVPSACITVSCCTRRCDRVASLRHCWFWRMQITRTPPSGNLPRRAQLPRFCKRTFSQTVKWATIDLLASPTPQLTSERPVEIFNLKEPNGVHSLPIGPTKMFVAANDEATFAKLRTADQFEYPDEHGEEPVPARRHDAGEDMPRAQRKRADPSPRRHQKTFAGLQDCRESRAQMRGNILDPGWKCWTLHSPARRGLRNSVAL